MCCIHHFKANALWQALSDIHIALIVLLLLLLQRTLCLSIMMAMFSSRQRNVEMQFQHLQGVEVSQSCSIYFCRTAIVHNFLYTHKPFGSPPCT